MQAVLLTAALIPQAYRLRPTAEITQNHRGAGTDKICAIARMVLFKKASHGKKLNYRPKCRNYDKEACYTDYIDWLTVAIG